MIKLASVMLGIGCVVLMSSCAETIQKAPELSGQEVSSGDVETAPLIVHSENGDGTWSTEVDASSESEWVYLELESRGEVKVPDLDGDDLPDPEAFDGWDLGFQRFKIKTNGGISGAGGVVVAILPSEEFESLSRAPADGYIEDAEDGPDDDTDDDLAFLGEEPWYLYDPVDHSLTSREWVYVVRTFEENYYKIQLFDYYSSAGRTSGYPQFRWAKIEAPLSSSETVPPGITRVDASDADAWIYLNVNTMRVVDLEDPMSSRRWDLGLSRTKMRTNSGSSGGGLAGAKWLDADYDALTKAPTMAYSEDAMVPLPGPPGVGEFSGNPVLNQWYDYDASTHAVTPKEGVFILRTALGEYVKLQVVSYDSGEYDLRFGALEVEVSEVRAELEAKEGWTYLSLRTGALIEAPMVDSLDWDLALSRTKVKTNSGTSGLGAGGAVEVEAASFETLTMAPAGSGCYLPQDGHRCDCELEASFCSDVEGVWTDQCACPAPYIEDDMLSNPVPSGSGEFSGNSVLSDWYDYDSSTHAVTPRDALFIVRTANGDFAKLEFSSYDDGLMGVRWSYAGAGQSQF